MTEGTFLPEPGTERWQEQFMASLERQWGVRLPELLPVPIR